MTKRYEKSPAQVQKEAGVAIKRLMEKSKKNNIPYDKLQKEYTEIYHSMWKYKLTPKYKEMQDKLDDLEYKMDQIKAKNAAIARDIEIIERTAYEY